MIRIEFSSGKDGICACCGQKCSSYSRKLFRNENHHGFCFMQFTPSHLDGILHGLINIGNWNDLKDVKSRTSFPFKVKMFEDQLQVMLSSSEDSPWKNDAKLGSMMDREQTVRHVLKKEVLTIIDELVRTDKAMGEIFPVQQ